MDQYSYLPTLKSCTKILLLCVVALACSDKQLEFPILKDEDKQVQILVDMYIAEAALNKQSIAHRDSLQQAFRDNIILIHELSEEQFDSLIWLIQTDMDRYSELHKQVLERLKNLDSKQSTK